MVNGQMRLGGIGLGLGVLLLLGPFLVEFAELPWVLLSGWWSAAGRILTALQAGAASVLGAATTLVVVVIGTHCFLSWLCRPASAPPRAPELASRSRWRWRWTFSLHLAFWLTLFAAMSLIGVVHQTAWLAVAD